MKIEIGTVNGRQALKGGNSSLSAKREENSIAGLK